MEDIRYERVVEEAITIKRRSRRDQGRLMLLIKEVNDSDRLKEFCEDINLSVPAARNYLAAWDKAEEMGIVPGSGPGADEMIQEMWDTIFDPTLNDARYSTVDRDGVEGAAKDMNLRGPLKAMDIAKNPKSMTAAIVGDGKCAHTAADAVLLRMKSDEDLREYMENQMLLAWRLQGRGGSGHGPSIHNDEFFRKLYDKVRAAARRAYDIEDLPEHLLGYAEGRLIETKGVIDSNLEVVKARQHLNHVNV